MCRRDGVLSSSRRELKKSCTRRIRSKGFGKGGEPRGQPKASDFHYFSRFNFLIVATELVNNANFGKMSSFYVKFWITKENNRARLPKQTEFEKVRGIHDSSTSLFRRRLVVTLHIMYYCRYVPTYCTVHIPGWNDGSWKKGVKKHPAATTFLRANESKNAIAMEIVVCRARFFNKRVNKTLILVEMSFRHKNKIKKKREKDEENNNILWKKRASTLKKAEHCSLYDKIWSLFVASHAALLFFFFALCNFFFPFFLSISDSNDSHNEQQLRKREWNLSLYQLQLSRTVYVRYGYLLFNRTSRAYPFSTHPSKIFVSFDFRDYRRRYVTHLIATTFELFSSFFFLPSPIVKLREFFSPETSSSSSVEGLPECKTVSIQMSQNSNTSWTLRVRLDHFRWYDLVYAYRSSWLALDNWKKKKLSNPGWGSNERRRESFRLFIFITYCMQTSREESFVSAARRSVVSVCPKVDSSFALRCTYLRSLIRRASFFFPLQKQNTHAHK